jgi:hypothetical protein
VPEADMLPLDGVDAKKTKSPRLYRRPVESPF